MGHQEEEESEWSATQTIQRPAPIRLKKKKKIQSLSSPRIS